MKHNHFLVLLLLFIIVLFDSVTVVLTNVLFDSVVVVYQCTINRAMIQVGAVGG